MPDAARNQNRLARLELPKRLQNVLDRGDAFSVECLAKSIESALDIIGIKGKATEASWYEDKCRFVVEIAPVKIISITESRFKIVKEYIGIDAIDISYEGGPILELTLSRWKAT